MSQNYAQLEERLDQNYSGTCKHFILPKIFLEYAKYSLIYSYFLRVLKAAKYIWFKLFFLFPSDLLND